jgi:hypothetical protein
MVCPYGDSFTPSWAWDVLLLSSPPGADLKTRKAALPSFTLDSRLRLW